MKVLLVEDDRAIAESLKIRFRVSGYELAVSPNLANARRSLGANEFAVMILDLNLPDGSGFDLLKEVHQSHANLPVVVLTAHADGRSATKGLALGAVDYVRKPFDPDELVARVDLALRRSPLREQSFQLNNFAINFGDKRVVYGEQEIPLTPREFEVLKCLTRRLGFPVSREELMNRIDPDGAITEKTMETHIYNLRKKLEKVCGHKVKIESKYGVGFSLHVD